MGLVKFGRVWEINSLADYNNAIETLDGNEFCAEMSDDFSAWKREKAEVAKQRAEVITQAKAKGII